MINLINFEKLSWAETDAVSALVELENIGGMKMLNKTIWVIITVIIALVMLFNRKTRVTQILAAQLRVFRNAKTRKTSIWDSICFIVMPVIVAIIISFDLGWEINSDTFTGTDRHGT